MKTIYSYFADHYHALVGQSDSAAVKQGITAYLKSLGISAEEEYDEETANRTAQIQLARFNLMPAESFVAFFENYDVRVQLTYLLEQTEHFAFDRAVTGALISKDEYKATINAFYSESSSIIDDKRYTPWFENALEDLTKNLKYAVGESDTIPEKVAERITFQKQYE